MRPGEAGPQVRRGVVAQRWTAALAVVVALQASAARGGWRAEGVLTGFDAAAGDAFGTSVAIDGDWLAVGAAGRDDGATDAGAVYLFRRDGQAWAPQGKLTAPQAEYGAGFGHSVAVGCGRVVVGAWRDRGDEGAAYVFDWDGAAWSDPAVLTASDADEGDNFGCSVAVSGERVVVGAYSNDDAGGGSGSAYVFDRGGGSWRQEAKLTASDAEAGDQFGWSVSVSGARIAVGASGSSKRGDRSGAVYVFERAGGGWDEAPGLLAPDGAALDEFGRSVSIDGDRMLVGAPCDEGVGSAYVFRADGSSWAMEAKLTGLAAGQQDRFGWSVWLDGGRAVVGASGHDAAGAEAGAAHVFDLGPDGWALSGKLTAASGSNGKRLGDAVAAGDGTVVAGAVGDGEDGQDTGWAFAFAEAQTDWQGPLHAAGRWSDANNWTAGVPAFDVDATIGNEGTAEVRSGSAAADTLSVGAATGGALVLCEAVLEAGGVEVSAAGHLAADAASTICVSRCLSIAAEKPGQLDLTEATVRVVNAGGDFQRLEAAGEDRGAEANGWIDNFAIGRLVVAPAAALRLVDAFDNGADPAAGQAVYVGELLIEPGGRIDHNGLPLYYRNGGWARALVGADTDLSGAVDYADYRAVLDGFGLPAGAGWGNGDSDGDGDVDHLDYLALKRNYSPAGAAALAAADLPEPATMWLLAAGAGLLAMRRRSAPRQS